MEYRQLRHLSLQGSLIRLFLCNIQQNPLPVERISLLVANEIRIFLDPDNRAIAPDQTVFVQKTGATAVGLFVFLKNTFPILGMDRGSPYVRIAGPLLCRITRQLFN